MPGLSVEVRGPEEAPAERSVDSVVTKPLMVPYSRVGVGIGSVTPARIDITMYERSPMLDTGLFAKVLGNISGLDGQTLYLFAQEPLRMFSSASATVVSRPEPGLSVLLQGGTVLYTAGTFSDVLQLWACLDPQCTYRLGNVPYAVPYTVSVLRGYRLPGSDQDPVAVQDVRLPPATFGQPPPAGHLLVTPPERTSLAELTASASWVPHSSGWRLDDALQPTVGLSDNGDGRVMVTVNLPSSLPVATYGVTVYLGSTRREANNYGPQTVVVRFTQEVRPSPGVTVDSTTQQGSMR